MKVRDTDGGGPELTAETPFAGRGTSWRRCAAMADEGQPPLPPQQVMDALRRQIMRERVAALRTMADDLAHLAVYSGVIDHVLRAADQLEREVAALG